MAGPISNPAVSANSVVDTPIVSGGASSGGYLVEQKDQKKAQTEAQFGEVLKQIQSKYGAKAEKPREIKKTLGKDDFLKIMITQMKNQDPTKPFNADEMAAQMAQYASVEQLQNVNQNLNKMQTDHQSSDRMAMTNFIGKTVTVDRERFPHTEGTNESLGFGLSRNASEVKISVINEAGETVLEKDLGPQKAGEQTFAWDGLKSNTLPSKSGSYTFKIAAKDERGNPLPTNPKSQGKIIGVSFEGSEPEFLIGDAHSQQKVSMRNIIRIDDVDGQEGTAITGGRNIVPGAGGPQAGQAAGGAQGVPGAAASVPPALGSNFFSFTKGVGSQNLEGGALPTEAQQAIAKYEAQRAQAQAEQAAAPHGAPGAAPVDGSTSGVAQLAQGEQQIGAGGKGFPSGLSQ